MVRILLTIVYMCLHVPKDERCMLDVKSKACISIGYGQDEFGYRC